MSVSHIKSGNSKLTRPEIFHSLSPIRNKPHQQSKKANKLLFKTTVGTCKEQLPAESTIN